MYGRLLFFEHLSKVPQGAQVSRATQAQGTDTTFEVLQTHCGILGWWPTSTEGAMRVAGTAEGYWDTGDKWARLNDGTSAFHSEVARCYSITPSKYHRATGIHRRQVRRSLSEIRSTAVFLFHLGAGDIFCAQKHNFSSSNSQHAS